MEKVKVLIVDDDPMISFLHKALVIRRNICSSPEGFMNGKEVLEFLINDSEREKECLYLILLDLNMPVMNGWEFLQALKELKMAGRTSVVIVTSSINQQDREKANTSRLVSEYIEKPLNDFSPVVRVKRELEERIKKKRER